MAGNGGAEVSDFVPDVTDGQIAHLPKATSAKDIDHAFIEGRGACKPGDDKSPGCFLTDWQRMAIVGFIGDRANAALSAAGDALGLVGMEEALRKEPDPDLLTGLVIDALGVVAGAALKTAAKWVRGAGDAALKTGEIAQIHIRHKQAVSPTADADDSPLGFVIKTGVEAGKKGAKGAVGNGEFEREQAESKSFIASMRRDLAMSFEHMREDPLAVANDAQLIVLYHSWSARFGHNIERYAAEFRAKLERFRGSTASKMGRTDRVNHGEKPMDIAKRGDTHGAIRKASDDRIRDTKLVFLQYADGSPSELRYYKRDYKPLPFMGGQGSYDTHDEDKNDLMAENAEDDTWIEIGPVEAEFADAAIAGNQRAWGKPYDVQHLPAPINQPSDYVPKTKSVVHDTNTLAPPAVHSPVMVDA